MKLLAQARRFLADEDGALISTEMVLWSTVLVIGLVVGFAAVRFAVVEFYLEQAEALATRETYTFGTDPRALGTDVLTTGTFFVENDPFPGTDSGGVERVPATEGELP